MYITMETRDHGVKRILRKERLAGFSSDCARLAAYRLYDWMLYLVPKSTGKLMRSIEVKILGPSRVAVSAGYPVEGTDRSLADLQEFGFEPHSVPVYTHPALRAWFIRKGIKPPWNVTISKFTPFFDPALERVKNEVPQIIDQSFQRNYT